jgi:P-type Na+/K+ transporter
MSTSSPATVFNKEEASTPSGVYVPPHVRPSEDLLKEFNVDTSKGLSTERAALLLAENGPNQLKPPTRPSKLKILLGQITNAMTIVLLGAMAVSLGTQDWIAMGVIGALVTLNVGVGYKRTSLSDFPTRNLIYHRGMECRKGSRWPCLSRKSRGHRDSV